jgi:hypothetical protein
MAGGRQVTATFAPEATPPSVPDQTLPAKRFQKVKPFAVQWSSTDADSGVANYDVRVRKAPYNRLFGPYTDWLTNTPDTTAIYPGEPGFTYCFSSRARDNAGNVSAYSKDRCTTVPVDDRTLDRTGRWTAGRGAYLAQTHLRTTERGASLELPGVKAKKIIVIVDRCPACGAIDIFWKGTKIRHFNLASEALKKRQFIQLPKFAKLQAGKLRIVVTSNGKKVLVDAIGVAKGPG